MGATVVRGIRTGAGRSWDSESWLCQQEGWGLRQMVGLLGATIFLGALKTGKQVRRRLSFGTKVGKPHWSLGLPEAAPPYSATSGK